MENLQKPLPLQAHLKEKYTINLGKTIILTFYGLVFISFITNLFEIRYSRLMQTLQMHSATVTVVPKLIQPVRQSQII